MEWSIHDLAVQTGITTRTLRHYHQQGLLTPSRTGHNGYRYYDQDALVRLQRILLLRDLGLSLPAIGDVLHGQQDITAALREHLRLLHLRRHRIKRQIESVTTTLQKIERGEPLLASEMFNGFDHTRYEHEVTQRWGRNAWVNSDRSWRALSDDQKESFQRQHLDIARDYGRAHAAGKTADSDEVQAIAQRHYDWLSLPMPNPSRSYIIGLGQMYVTDPRFAANYDRHGHGTTTLVRDAMTIYAERHLHD